MPAYSTTPASAPRCASRSFGFFTAFPAYRGLSLDIENLPDDASPGYMTFLQELYADLHPRNLRLYVNTAVSTTDEDLKQIAANSDGVVLMNYDQHQIDSQPGPIASQDWFVDNLTRVLKIVPKEKLICAMGNYGYDWTLSIPPRPKEAGPEGVAKCPRSSIRKTSRSPMPCSAPPTPTPT